MVANGDPAWRPAVAPIIRWAQERWWAEFPKCSASPAIPKPMLKKVWRAVSEDPPASWDGARGAVDAAYVSARRIGWCFTDFETMSTDQGTVISLATTSPSLLAKLLREAVQRRRQR